MQADNNGEPNIGEPRLRPASSPRTTTWSLFFALSTAATITWASLPTLEAHPLLRVALFATLGFSMLGLIFLFPQTTDRTALRTFAGSGDFNAPLFTLLAASGIPLETTRLLCLTAFALSAAAITIAGYFIAWKTQATLGWWGFGHAVAAAIWFPWLLAAIAQHRHLPAKWLARPAPGRSEGVPPPELSIVVPTLKPTPELTQLIQNLRNQTPTSTEIIISTCDPAFPEIPTTRTVQASGGFPAQPLMEDVEASLRLATQGKIIYLGHEWTVSAKKWSSGFFKRFLLIIRLVASYQLARLRSRQHAAALSEKMYREYYPPAD